MTLTLSFFYRTENPDIKFIEEFVSKTLETILFTAFHPRTCLTIILQEIQNDGPILSTCLHAACFALLDAGFPMKCTLASTSVIINADGLIVMNASEDEIKSCIASFDIIFSSDDNRIISIKSEGNFSFNQFRQCFKLCKESAQEIFQFYRDTIQMRFTP